MAATSTSTLRTNLEKQREAAWERYASTVRTGGTKEQRRWAFERAMEVETKYGKADSANRRRDERRRAAHSALGETG